MGQQETSAAAYAWHSFDQRTFELGRDRRQLDEDTSIGLYSADRSVIDAFRLMRDVGSEVAFEALRRWLRAGGQPARLLAMAGRFARTERIVRDALEVLG